MMVQEKEIILLNKTNQTRLKFVLIEEGQYKGNYSIHQKSVDESEFTEKKGKVCSYDHIKNMTEGFIWIALGDVVPTNEEKALANQLEAKDSELAEANAQLKAMQAKLEAMEAKKVESKAPEKEVVPEKTEEAKVAPVKTATKNTPPKRPGRSSK